MGAGASSSSDIDWKVNRVRKQLECQDVLVQRLAAKGLKPADGNFKTALDLAKSSGAIDQKRYDGYKYVNRQANDAKHRW